MQKQYKIRVGSRAQVMHGTAMKTSGGLTKKDLKYNKHGKIVSVKASKSAKKSDNLVKAGYVTKKGVFGSTINKKIIKTKQKGGNGNVNGNKFEFYSAVSGNKFFSSNNSDFNIIDIKGPYIGQKTPTTASLKSVFNPYESRFFYFVILSDNRTQNYRSFIIYTTKEFDQTPQIKGVFPFNSNKISNWFSHLEATGFQPNPSEPDTITHISTAYSKVCEFSTIYFYTPSKDFLEKNDKKFIFDEELLIYLKSIKMKASNLWITLNVPGKNQSRYKNGDGYIQIFDLKKNNIKNEKRHKKGFLEIEFYGKDTASTLLVDLKSMKKPTIENYSIDNYSIENNYIYSSTSSQ